MGYTSAQSQLLTIPPYAAATLLTLMIAILSSRARLRAPFILGTTSLAITGYVILLANTAPRTRPGLSYAGTVLAAVGIYPSVALVLCWPAVNVSAQTKRATANALQISIGNLGAVMGTQLYRAGDGPRYIVGHSVALGYLAANLGVVSVLWVVLLRENAQKERVLADEARRHGHGDDEDSLALGDGDPRWKFQI